MRLKLFFTLNFPGVCVCVGGGGYSTDAWVGRCCPGSETLTLFKTQASDFTVPFKEARKGFFGCYSVCETMKDTKEGYFIM